uniref:Anti-sigma-factor antagonist n=1 Tax=Rhodopseudomonas palustris (strain BisA53) TaxID=316055 RepID=Q07SN5_RHOP5
MTQGPIHDNISRNVHALFGIPIDVDDMPAILARIINAAQHKSATLISTANLNFLTTSLTDPEFRESLLSSDLCTADGMPIVWLARLNGIPVKERVAGSDLFVGLKHLKEPFSSLSVFLFGGAEGVAEQAAKALAAESTTLHPAGFLSPGFCSIDELSADRFIDAINASKADFLSVSLGAVKGQAWLLKNWSRLSVPVCAHLGATINFQAGTIKRAPHFLRRVGLEWVWRIKEEPCLRHRYFNDFRVLVRLLFMRVLPLWIQTLAKPHSKGASDFSATRLESERDVRLVLSGCCMDYTTEHAIPHLRGAIASRKDVVLDLSKARFIDTRFLGLLLMVRKQLRHNGLSLTICAPSKPIRRLLKLHEVDYLLSPQSGIFG